MSVLSVSGRDCGYCHGKGRVRTHVGVSGYGVNNRKNYCNQCKKYYSVSENHWHTCPQCKGSGSAGSRHTHSNNGSGEDIYLRYLSADEYADYQYCLKMAMSATEQVECDNCRATGVCPACKGSGLSPLQGGFDPDFGYMPNPCPVCHGIKNCVKCSGLKWVNVESERLKTLARNKLKYYSDLVRKRQAARM